MSDNDRGHIPANSNQTSRKECTDNYSSKGSIRHYDHRICLDSPEMVHGIVDRDEVLELTLFDKIPVQFQL